MAKKDEEDRYYESSPEFWEMIRQRRLEPTIPFAEVKKELLGEERPTRKRKRKKSVKKRTEP